MDRAATRAAALAALITYTDAAGPTDDIDGRITELITSLAALTGDPNAVLDTARAKVTEGPRRYYRSADAVRMNTAGDLVQHYNREWDRLHHTGNRIHGAVLRAIRAGNEEARDRSKAKWEANGEAHQAVGKHLIAVCAAFDAAKAAWFGGMTERTETTA